MLEMCRSGRRSWKVKSRHDEAIESKELKMCKSGKR